MYFTPFGSTLYVLWQTFGSLVLLRGLEAVVATVAAEETGEALTVPFEAAVAFLLGSIAAVGVGAAATVLESRSGDSESFGCSDEKSSVKLDVSMKGEMKAETMGTHQPAVDGADMQRYILPVVGLCIYGRAMRRDCPAQLTSSCLA